MTDIEFTVIQNELNILNKRQWPMYGGSVILISQCETHTDLLKHDFCCKKVFNQSPKTLSLPTYTYLKRLIWTIWNIISTIERVSCENDQIFTPHWLDPQILVFQNSSQTRAKTKLPPKMPPAITSTTMSMNLWSKCLNLEVSL